VETHQQDYVVADDGNLRGIVSVSMLRYRPKDSWADTPLRDVLRGNSPSAMADEPVEDALQRMTENSLTALPVLERHTEELLGVVTSQDLLELIVTDAKTQR
jgi:CBS domain-containing protein